MRIERPITDELAIYPDPELSCYKTKYERSLIDLHLYYFKEQFKLNVFYDDEYLFTIIAPRKIDISDYMFANDFINIKEDYTRALINNGLI